MIQHQKAKHFKCHICHKKLYTGPGLAIHCMQVHKDNIDKVPNALPNRNSVDIEIYGMEGIPPRDLEEHERSRGSEGSSSSASVGSSSSFPLAAPSVPSGLLPKPVLPPTGLLGATPLPGILPSSVPLAQGFATAPPPGLPGIPFPGLPGFPPPPVGVPPGQIRHPFSFPPPPLIPPTTNIPAPPTGSVPNQPPPPVAFQMNLPRKPLFPAAASALLSQPPPPSSSTVSSGPSSGASYSAPALPAGQAGPSSSSLSNHPTGPLVPPTNTTARIVHPPEDLSLEELRARHTKYQMLRKSNSFSTGVDSNDNNGLVSGINFKEEIMQ